MSTNTNVSKKVTIIGIAGGTGSGKTTIANKLFDATKTKGSVLYLKMDDYYKKYDDIPVNELGAKNFDHPESYDVELLTNHLNKLKNFQSIDKPLYDFVISDRLEQTILVKPADVVIIDGIMTFAHPKVRETLDIKIYVDTPDDIRFIRRLERDILERGRTVESIVNQYTSSVRPMHHAFVEPSKQYADIIVPSGGHNNVAIDVITNQILSLLK
jgi:uridine kinase